MVNKKRRGFTLIELIAVLVIMAILVLIVTPLVMSIIKKAKISVRKRSVDAYGRSVELAIASYLLDNGKFPTNEQLPNLEIEYSGSTVVCNVMSMKENGGLYLSECKVNNVDVKDSSTEDGWYHYGTRDLTNEEFVDMYGDSLKKVSVAYYNTNGTPVEDYTTLTIDYKGKPVACDVTVNYDGTIYMTKCKVNNVEVRDDNEEDGYYHYGSIVEPTAVQSLIAKSNPITTTNYIDGNVSEMYTFSHSDTSQTPTLTDYRYIGSSPNNYVYFNGNQLWRIIGVFTVEDANGTSEQRVKIVTNNYTTLSSWNSRSDNKWVNSLVKGTVDTYYSNFDESTKNLVADTKYYLGEGPSSNSNGSVYYTYERGGSDNWLGKIGLMYPSDYLYTYALGVSNSCYSNSSGCSNYNSGWMYSNYHKWTISPAQSSYGSTGLVHIISNSGPISSGYSYNAYVESVYYIYSTLYLNSQVKIESGDGSQANPYRLKM